MVIGLVRQKKVKNMVGKFKDGVEQIIQGLLLVLNGNQVLQKLFIIGFHRSLQAQ